MKSDGHDHKLMKSSIQVLERIMKTARATYKYPDQSIKRVILAKGIKDERDRLFWLCVNRGRKEHKIMTSADSGSLFISTRRQAEEKGASLGSKAHIHETHGAQI